jgi:N-acyl-D-amino-acid deacylase
MHDVVIREGTVLDGSGRPGRRGDVAIDAGRISSVGEAPDRGRREIDAEGRFVAPGFIDGHTHLDAQIFWDPISASLSSHGVTTAVMGNCGFTLAPSGREQMDLAIRSIERAEDMSRDAIVAGVDWTWQTFSDYLDAVDRLPKSFNYASYVGHSALRAYVMGERAFEAGAGDDDIGNMMVELERAMRAGAIGFSTSRSFHHLTWDDEPVASRQATWEEVRALIAVLGRLDTGLFQLAPERHSDPERRGDFTLRLAELIRDTGRPATFMLGSDGELLDLVRVHLDPSGPGPVGQTNVRSVQNVYSFETYLPFDPLPTWQATRRLPLERQLAELARPDVKARLVDEAMHGRYARGVGAEARPPEYDHFFLVGGDGRSVAQIAAAEGTTPVDVIIDRALAAGLTQCFYQPMVLVDPARTLALLKRPDTVIAASDSGAHVSQILDSSIPGYFLAHWVRERQDFEWSEAVRMLTRDPAEIWGFRDRGILRPGAVADVVVFDPETVGSSSPRVVRDGPDGGPRLVQQGTGFDAVLVGGQVTWEGGTPTGARPGRLIRRGSTQAGAAA